MSTKENERIGHSVAGIASFVIGLVVLAAMLIGTRWAWVEVFDRGASAAFPGILVLFPMVHVPGVFFSLVGIGVGIAGVRDKTKKRIFAVLGIALNEYSALGIVAFEAWFFSAIT